MMRGVDVTFKDGKSKYYSCTGYDVKNFGFKSGKSRALYLFHGKNKRATKLKLSNIRTWKVRS